MSASTVTTRTIVRAELPTRRAPSLPVSSGVLLAVIGTLLWRTVPGLTSTGLNYDEAFAVRVARGSWSELATVAASREPWMVVHDLVLRCWGGVFGWSVTSVRALSIGALVITVVLVFRIGSRLFGARTGLLAAAVTSAHPTCLALGERATGQALAAALVSVAVLALTRLVDGRPSGRSAAIVAVVVAGWSSPFGGPAVVAAGLSLAVVAPSSRRALARVGIVAAVGWSPLAVHLISGSASSSGWFGAASAQQDAVRTAGATLAGSGAFWSAAAVVVTGFVALAGWWRRRTLVERAVDDPGVPVVMAWAFVPISAAAVVTLMVPVISPAELDVCVPAVALTVAAAVRLVWNLRWWSLVAGSTVAIVLLAGTGIAEPAPPDWRAAAALLDTGREGDVVMVVPSFEIHALAYAIGERGGIGPDPSASVASSWSSVPVDDALTGTVRCEASCGAVWVVSTTGYAQSAAGLSSGWRPAQTRDLAGLTVVRYVR